MTGNLLPPGATLTLQMIKETIAWLKSMNRPESIFWLLHSRSKSLSVTLGDGNSAQATGTIGDIIIIDDPVLQAQGVPVNIEWWSDLIPATREPFLPEIKTDKYEGPPRNRHERRAQKHK